MYSVKDEVEMELFPKGRGTYVPKQGPSLGRAPAAYLRSTSRQFPTTLSYSIEDNSNHRGEFPNFGSCEEREEGNVPTHAYVLFALH